MLYDKVQLNFFFFYLGQDNGFFVLKIFKRILAFKLLRIDV